MVLLSTNSNLGILREIKGIKAALAVKGITDVQITIKPGEMLEPLPKGDRYLGFLFAEGKDQDTVKIALQEAWLKIKPEANKTINKNMT